MDLADTIVAVSSPAGAAERAIVRLSGSRAVEIAGRVFASAGAGDIPSWPTWTAGPGRLAPLGAGLAVPAVAYLMRGPASYTREDVVEFHMGAWPAVVPLVVEGLLAAGARAAEPGEFTFRALVQGRLDAAQAEAVMSVVDAGSRAALRAAGEMLAGSLSREVERLSGRVREVLALVEVGLDFSDQDIEPVAPAEVAARLADVRRDVAEVGRRCRSIETFGGEARLVLAGWPNVGKSSLFNRLLADDPSTEAVPRAIVAPAAGTTRDELRGAVHVGGMTLTLSDVAGLDAARDEVERGAAAAAGTEVEGKARARALEAIGRADLVILVLDATAPSYDRTDQLLALVAAPMVVAITKCDLAPPDRARAWLADRAPHAEAVATSAATGQGIGDLREALARAVAGGAVDRDSCGPVMT
ncbi:MAG: 50S ribosome-binding GTPase, partial [Planctomycetes bacterium]|nr:50S ribosome-binding GTPase [Planctomycetota bacterium]